MTKQSMVNYLILTPYLIMFPLVAIVEDGGKKMVAVAIASILASISRYGLDIPRKNIKNTLLWVVIAMAMYLSIQDIFQGGSAGQVRAFICASLLLLFTPFSLLNQRVLFVIAFIGAFSIAINTSYYAFFLGQNRWAGPLNPIPYATISAVATIISVHFLFAAQNNIHRFISLTSLLLALIGVAYSMTRGIWLALIVAIVLMLLIRIFSHQNKKQRMTKYLSVFVIISALLIAAFHNSIMQRFNATKYEYQNISTGNLDTSIGMRFQMWDAAGKIIPLSPWFGVGRQHTNILDDLNKQGLVSDTLNNYKTQHYHNQYIDMFVKYGVIGLLLTLMLFIVPFKHALRSDSETRSIILGLLSLYFVAGLTDVPLLHAETILVFTCLLVPLMDFPPKADQLPENTETL